MTRLVACFGAAACLACGGTSARGSGAGAGEDTLDTMPAAQAIPLLTQRLFDALPGDSAVWRHYLSDSAVYVGEDGEITSKDELIDGFAPFPQGLSGSIVVESLRIVDLGGLAVSVFDALEKETVYDQRIEVNYRSTHTWRREHGRWRLLAGQTVVLAQDPPAFPVDTLRLSDFAGTYELSGQRRYRVERRGAALAGGPEGGELSPLIAVGDNVFADSHSNLGVLRIFVRGPDGAVARMVQRRKFADLIWTRVAATGERE